MKTDQPMIKELPILMSGFSVRAILAGRKTQTRRTSGLDIINFDPGRWAFEDWPKPGYVRFKDQRNGYAHDTVRCPYGPVGTKLWARESHWIQSRDAAGVHVQYLADGEVLACRLPDDVDPYSLKYAEYVNGRKKWRPAIHMPRWASRIILEKTGERVERVQEISEEDAMKEGFYQAVREREHGVGQDVIGWFAKIWDSLHADPKPVGSKGKIVSYVSYPWEDICEDRVYRGKPWHVRGNPHISVTEFKVVEIKT